MKRRGRKVRRSVEGSEGLWEEEGKILAARKSGEWLDWRENLFVLFGI